MKVMNVCPMGRAAQSSLSEWSTEGEWAAALVPDADRVFAFHTALQSKPFWTVDLGHVYLLDNISIHNRRDGWQERASSLVVETSQNGKDWTLVHRGFVSFGDSRNPGPLVLPLSGQLPVRHIRLSLPGDGVLHLAQVEAFALMEASVLGRFKLAHGLRNLDVSADSFDGQDLSTRYCAVAPPDNEDYTELVGLQIGHSGRFGNYLQQVTHAILLAQRTGLGRIQLAPHPIITVDHEVEAGGIAFTPPTTPLKPGLWMRGIYFDPEPFQPVLGRYLDFGRAIEADHCRVAQEIVRPSLLAPGLVGAHGDDPGEIVVHLRSGDIFAGSAVDSGYRQPPLAFYTLSISHLIEAGQASKVKLVYEDAGNPVIAALLDWLSARGIEHRSQSGSLMEDLAALVDPAHLIVSFGTFGYAIARLSRRIRSVYYFEPELGGAFRHIPHIDRVYAVADAAGGYIKAGVAPPHYVGEWRNAPDQRAMMVDYPASRLSLKRVR